jgi:PAS domain S-box-containing protein
MLNKNSYKKHFFSSLLLIFLINIFITGLLYYFLVTKAKENIYIKNIDEAQYNFQKTQMFIKRHIAHYKNNLDSLEKSSSFKEYLKGGTRDKVIENMNLIIESNKPIFQIRYLDKEGLEKIRIDRDNNGRVFRVEKLQDKSKRYYFTKTASLKRGEYYVSNLDLNIENGQIEIPYKPTIRISKPVFQNGEFKGILILNYLAWEIIEKINNLRNFNVYFMDNNLNFFLHPDKKKCFSSQLGTNLKVEQEIPNIFKIINNGSLDKNNVYYVNKVTSTDDDFFIIYSLKQYIYDNAVTNIKKDLSYLFIIVFLVTLPLVLLASYIHSSQAELLEKIIDTIPFPIFFKDEKGKFIMVNNYFSSLYGFKDKDALIGKISYDFLDGKYARKCKIRDRRALKCGEVEQEEEIVLENGKKYYFDVIIVKLAYLGILKRTFLLGVAVDITDIKTLNLQLEQKIKDELEARLNAEKLLIQQSKMAEMGNMLSVILHQWKQPLSVISVISSGLQMQMELDEQANNQKIKKNMEEINEQVNFMTETASDFKDFFSLSKQNRNFKVLSSVKKIDKLLSHRIKTSQSSLVYKIDEDLEVYGFEKDFAQVILNLINNSLDAFKDKDIHPKLITIEGYTEKGKTVIKVKDNAGGIPEELLPDKLFQDYLTTKGDEGTGIGLSICKKILSHNFKAELTAYNENEGAVFKIII